MSESSDERGGPLPPRDEDQREIDHGEWGGLGDDGPVGLRLGRNPGNLEDEIPDSGDVTHPPPQIDTPPEM